MSDETPRQEPASNESSQIPEGCGCGSGCNCGPKGLAAKWKMLICLVIVIAAGAVMAHGIMARKAQGTGCSTGASSGCCASTTSAPETPGKCNQ